MRGRLDELSSQRGNRSVRTCGGWRGGKPNPCDGYVGLNAALELFAFALDECSR